MSATPLTCCTAEGAWAWVDLLSADALDGDRISLRLLPFAITHALIIEAQAQ